AAIAVGEDLDQGRKVMLALLLKVMEVIDDQMATLLKIRLNQSVQLLLVSGGGPQQPYGALPLAYGPEGPVYSGGLANSRGTFHQQALSHAAQTHCEFSRLCRFNKVIFRLATGAEDFSDGSARDRDSWGPRNGPL